MSCRPLVSSSEGLPHLLSTLIRPQNTPQSSPLHAINASMRLIGDSCFLRCTAGLVVECEIGFYNPNENANSQTACLPCPEQSTTLVSAAFSIEQCICVVGYYAANATGGLTCSPCTMLTPRTYSLTHHPYRLPYLSFFWVQPVLSLSNHLRRVQCYQAQLERIA